jgi:hypothetical protein
MVLGPLCGKSQVGGTKYSGLVLAMVPECLEVWSFKTGACWVDVLPDVAVAMLGRSACSWRITANQQQQESYQPINQIFWFVYSVSLLQRNSTKHIIRDSLLGKHMSACNRMRNALLPIILGSADSSLSCPNLMTILLITLRLTYPLVARAYVAAVLVLVGTRQVCAPKLTSW